MLKKFRCLVFAMVSILVVVSCTTFATVKPIRVVYGTTYSKDHFNTKGDLLFKKLVEKKSKGQILIDFFPQLQLGAIPEQLQATKTNAQQMFYCGPGVLAPCLPKLSTFDLPYLYRDQDHTIKVAKKFTSLLDQNEFVTKTGTRVLGFPSLNALRKLNTKFPVNKIEDIKGLKIRLPEIPVWQLLWRTAGAIVTVLPVTDLYTALATGTVEAHENTLDVSYTYKLYEQTKYCAFTNHIQEIALMVINNKFWNSLTASQQKILTDAAIKASAFKLKEALKCDAMYKKLLQKEGVKFTMPNLVPFREIAKPILDKYADKELLKKIEAIK